MQWAALNDPVHRDDTPGLSAARARITSEAEESADEQASPRCRARWAKAGGCARAPWYPGPPYDGNFPNHFVVELDPPVPRPRPREALRAPWASPHPTMTQVKLPRRTWGDSRRNGGRARDDRRGRTRLRRHPDRVELGARRTTPALRCSPRRWRSTVRRGPLASPRALAARADYPRRPHAPRCRRPPGTRLLEDLETLPAAGDSSACRRVATALTQDPRRARSG